MQEPPTPLRTFEFEHEVEQQIREAGRKVVEATYNTAEGGSHGRSSLPSRWHRWTWSWGFFRSD